jgi:hypothetical protein
MKNTNIAFITLSFLLVVSTVYGQQTYVPDDNFEAALIELGLDTGALNDSVPTDSIFGLVELIITEKGISDLTGIQDFTALEILRVDKNNLTSIDLSGNPNLIEANLGINDLTDLDLSQNPLLEILVLQHNEMTELDLSHNPNLKTLNMYSCGMTEIDLSQNLFLEGITLAGNPISEISVSHLANLRDLSVYTSFITDIDVSQNTQLQTLNLYNLAIDEVDVSQNPALSFLNIKSTEVSELDVTNNPAIYYLYISETDLSSIDISNNPELHRFWIDENKFQYPELEAVFAAETFEQFQGHFRYAPQQWIGERVDTTLEEGQSIVFEMTAYRPGSMDTIRWYKDGELMPGESAESLTLENLLPGDAGDYSAHITSGVVPDIELQSNVFRLVVDPKTGVDFTGQLDIDVYPNPASEYIHLDGEEVAYSLRLFDRSGQLLKASIISSSEPFFVGDYPSGTYFLEVKGSRGSSVIPLILE